MFNAEQYLTKLKGKDYLEVKWRLVWLRDQAPNALLTTSLQEHDPDRRYALFKAEVVIPNGGSATGWGSETGSDFGEYLEKAETKAIGRALGALGFGTQFTGPDFDEDGQRVVDSPVPARGVPAGRVGQQPRPAPIAGKDPAPIIAAGQAAQAEATVTELLEAFVKATTMQELNNATKRTPKDLDSMQNATLRSAYDQAKVRITKPEVQS